MLSPLRRWEDGRLSSPVATLRSAAQLIATLLASTQRVPMPSRLWLCGDGRLSKPRLLPAPPLNSTPLFASQLNASLMPSRLRSCGDGRLSNFASQRSAPLRIAPRLYAARLISTQGSRMINTALSPQVRRLADRFIGASIGSLVSYASLNDAAQQDVLQRRHWITTALRVAQREAGAVFVNERNVGYRRLTTEELPGVGFTSRKHIRSTARRASKAIVAGLKGSNDVPEPVKLRASSELAVLGLVEHLSRNQQVARHEAEPSPERVGEVARATMMRLQEAIGRSDGS